MSDWPTTKFPAFLATKSGTFSLTHDTALNVTGWTETYDATNDWDNANSRFVIPSPGFYFFQFACDFATTQVTGRRAIFLYNNTTSTTLSNMTVGNAGNLVSDRAMYDRVPSLAWATSAFVYATSTNVGDYIVPRATQNNGGTAALNILASAYTTFSGYRVS